MAEFCKQCSIEIFGEDLKDLAGLGSGPLPPEHGWRVICEGCGPTLVDDDGVCLGGCLKPTHDERVI